MTNKVSLVTGGSRGIGRSIVERLAREGFSVAVHSTKKGADAGIEMIAKLKDCYPDQEFRAYQADFSEGDIDFFEEVMADFGRIDVLVNNVGRVSETSHDQMSFAELEKIFRINYIAPQLLTSRVFEIMAAQKFGRIINIGSAATHFGMGRNDSIHYASTKAALENMMTAFSRLGAQHNITANTVAPGLVDTDIQKGRADIADRVALVPMKRMAQPEEVAGAVSYFVSSDASFVTNQTLYVSGGE